MVLLIGCSLTDGHQNKLTWLPLVLGPAFAMDKIPGPAKVKC
jgi:hypothetical protein